MKEPNLPITVLLSFLIHATFLIVALATIKQTNHFVMPSPYIVQLVGPETETAAVSEKKTAASPEKAAAPQSPVPGISKNQKSVKAEEEYASERIAAMEAKKRIKEAFRLRNIISIKGSGKSESVSVTETKQPSGNIGEEAYVEKIGAEIRQYYSVTPELKGKALETIISVTILKDGTIKIDKIEKSSGNLFFDRQVQKATREASPVSPPPYEMEIGLRFTP